MTAQLSRERLEEIRYCTWMDDLGLSMAELNEMARMLLAGMESEPVAYADPQAFRNFQAGTAKKEWMWRKPDAGLSPLYTAPPAPVAVPDDLLCMAASAIEDLLSNTDRGSSAAAWFDLPARLHAAMLKVDPVTAATVPDGWKLVPVEPTLAMLTVLGFTGSFESMKQRYASMLAAATAAPEQEV